MKKHHSLLLFLLVIFVMPSNSYACATCSKNNLDKKKLSLNKDKNNCYVTESHGKTKIIKVLEVNMVIRNVSAQQQVMVLQTHLNLF